MRARNEVDFEHDKTVYGRIVVEKSPGSNSFKVDSYFKQPNGSSKCEPITKEEYHKAHAAYKFAAPAVKGVSVVKK